MTIESHGILLYLPVYIVFNSVTSGSCWQYFTTFQDLIMESSEKEHQRLHSEYIFGECKRKDIRFYNQVRLDHLQVLGKVIVRGWVDLMRIPVCIRLRAYAHEEDLFRSTAFQFQMCVPRITYCHSQHRFKYYYYEWYIPPDLTGGMNWVISFFGVKTLDWG